MTLDAVEFMRRFLLHSLPKGFQRLRQYGFLAIASAGRTGTSGAAHVRERIGTSLIIGGASIGHRQGRDYEERFTALQERVTAKAPNAAGTLGA